MLFIRFVLSAVLLVSAFHVMCIAEGDSPDFLHYVPKEKSYTMDIQEVHQCVACHSNEQPKKDFSSCLRLLSIENKKLAKECCGQVYDEDFCKNAYGGKIDFDRICQDPSKAVQVNRCFWKTTDTTANDVQAYKQCRKRIIDAFCTTRTEE